LQEETLVFANFKLLVRADKLLTAFAELESVIPSHAFSFLDPSRRLRLRNRHSFP
jgi:hypothetical protein